MVCRSTIDNHDVTFHDRCHVQGLCIVLYLARRELKRARQSSVKSNAKRSSSCEGRAQEQRVRDSALAVLLAIGIVRRVLSLALTSKQPG